MNIYMEIERLDKYTEQLEDVIRQMLRPQRNIPLKLVIKSLCGYDILPFDKQDGKDRVTLNKLTAIAKEAGLRVNFKGIVSNRPNEVGNYIEPFVKAALNHNKYFASTPQTKHGKMKATGYPDIEFVDEFSRHHYLECKTFNIENVGTTQRSFYLSPSEDFKVNKTAHHFILSYEVFVDGRKENQNIYKVRSWKILSAEKMLVDVKYEFNSDNARMYGKDLLLAEGKI